MPTSSSRPTFASLPGRVLLVALLAATAVLVAPRAEAKLERDEWKQAEAEFERLFKERGELDAKKTLIELLIKDGESRSWRMLTQALVQECEIWGEILDKRGELMREHNDLLMAGGKVGRYTKEQEVAVQDLAAKLEIFEKRMSIETEVLDAVIDAIGKGPEALHKNIIRRAKSAKEWSMRAAAVRVAAMRPEASDNRRFLEKTIQRDPDARVRVAAVMALGKAEGTEEFILGSLADDEWGVVLAAVNVLRERKFKRAVPHLINALSLASPRLSHTISDTLNEITGENFGPFANLWQKWWEENGDEWEGKKTTKFDKDSGRGGFKMDVYGLRVRSDRVLFILDISGSMNKEAKGETREPDPDKPRGPVTGHRKGEEPPPPPPRLVTGPKINFARRQLKSAIQALPKGATFGIIAFNQASKAWKSGVMQEATKANKEDAYKWMRALAPKGSTYTDGALRLAFEKSGVLPSSVRTGYPEILVDTMVLITDGQPTDTQFHAQPMKPEEILAHVREWNKRKKVIIHTVGIDLDVGVGRDFLKPLAQENGGSYVEIER